MENRDGDHEGRQLRAHLWASCRFVECYREGKNTYQACKFKLLGLATVAFRLQNLGFGILNMHDINAIAAAV